MGSTYMEAKIFLSNTEARPRTTTATSMLMDLLHLGLLQRVYIVRKKTECSGDCIARWIIRYVPESTPRTTGNIAEVILTASHGAMATKLSFDSDPTQN